MKPTTRGQGWRVLVSDYGRRVVRRGLPGRVDLLHAVAYDVHHIGGSVTKNKTKIVNFLLPLRDLLDLQ